MYGQVAQFFPQRKEPEGSCGWGLVELEERLAATSKSRRLEERLSEGHLVSLFFRKKLVVFRPWKYTCKYLC